MVPRLSVGDLNGAPAVHDHVQLITIRSALLGIGDTISCEGDGNEVGAGAHDGIHDEADERHMCIGDEVERAVRQRGGLDRLFAPTRTPRMMVNRRKKVLTKRWSEAALPVWVEARQVPSRLPVQRIPPVKSMAPAAISTGTDEFKNPPIKTATPSGIKTIAVCASLGLKKGRLQIIGRRWCIMPMMASSTKPSTTR